MPTGLPDMVSLGSPATMPPLASTYSSLTIDDTMAGTTAFRNAALGSCNVTSNVNSSTTRLSATVSLSTPAAPSGRSISMTRSHEYSTSSAVSAEPSWNVTPSRIGNVYVSPSALMRPFSVLGTSVASPGTGSGPEIPISSKRS